MMLEIECMGLGGRVMWDNFSEGPGLQGGEMQSGQLLKICIDTLEEHNFDTTNQTNITLFPEAIDDL
jgi:hypothetical protein